MAASSLALATLGNFDAPKYFVHPVTDPNEGTMFGRYFVVVMKLESDGTRRMCASTSGCRTPEDMTETAHQYLRQFPGATLVQS